MSLPFSTDPEIDAHWMAQAIVEAKRGLGQTSPNPNVGAVIARGDELLGCGFHRRAGGPHAEVEAIADARARGHVTLPADATLYVTLEPCSTQGRTPPCTSAILAAGIRRVVYGSRDPNPAHAGAADVLLCQQGVEVVAGVLATECGELIRPFRKWITTGEPYIIAKVGQSLDGRINRPAGEPQWITSEEARKQARLLRQRVDAILVGAETVRRDDPLLTLREKVPGSTKTQPWRLILSRSGKLPENSQVFTDEFKERTIVLSSIDFADFLKKIKKYEITSILVEGGGQVMSQAFAGGHVDEVHWYLAPMIVGGGQTSLAGPALESTVHLTDIRIEALGNQIHLSGYPDWSASPAKP